MPRKTRTARLFRAFGRVQERAELVELLVAERPELRHHVVAELRRVLDVGREALDAAPALADRREIRCAEVRAAGTEIGVAGSAARTGEDGRAGDCLLVVLEALLRCPTRYGLHHLARERLLRGRALVGQDAHGEDDEDRRD